MRDPASADDAVQEAWLAAVRRRPDADRPLRPWLARVVVNAVRKIGRGRARVAARERAAARPEAAPDLPQMRERERLLRGLLDAVLTLPEREREVVLLRYYEGLPPREIAVRLGAPVEAVYGRLKRALGLLRERLDAAHGGTRPTWVLGLAGALGLPRSLLPTTLSLTGGAGAGAATSAVAAPAVLSGVLAMASATVPAVIVSLAAGLGVGWFVGHRGAGDDAAPPERAAPAAPAGAAASSVAPAPGAPGPVLEGQDPAAHVAVLRARVTSLEADVAKRDAELQGMKEKLAALTPPPFDPKALRFGLGGVTPAFDKADWTALSGHMSALAKVLGGFKQSALEGQPPGPDLMAALSEHNTPLALFAVAAASDLGGTGPNGAYTHPAVIANLIRAALIAANDPLTPAQETAVVALGKSWAAENERQVKAFAETTPDLARTVAEVDAKQRFLDATKELLTPSQRALLFHPETEGRLQLDLLSPALVYVLQVPVESLSADDLAAQVIPRLLAVAGLKDVDAGPLLGVGQRWLDEVPGGREPHPPRDPELVFPTVATIQGWARAEVAAIQRVVESGRLTPEQVKAVRKVRTLIVPYVVKAP